MFKWSWIVVFFVFTISCSEDADEILPPGTAPPSAFDQLDPFEQDVVNYFNEVALGFEFGNATKVTRKWIQPIKLKIEGSITPELEAELNDIIEEINNIATDSFRIEFSPNLFDFNVRIFFGSGSDYGDLNPGAKDFVSNNLGLFFVNWDGNQNLTSGDMYVDTERAEIAAQLHLLREELTQLLGLANDSKLYPESIFQQSWTLVTEYAPIDRELIRLLYHPRMNSGLNRMEVTDLLVELLSQD